MTNDHNYQGNGGTRLEEIHKGIGELSVAGQEKWNLLKEEVSLPAAVIYQDKLLNNLNWMQKFADTNGVKLAPHGKTTMSPALFQKQLDAGSWGITLASATQAAVACEAGVKRILMANQLVGKRNMEIVSSILDKVDFYCLVDSVDNVIQLGNFFSKRNETIKLLIEIGIPQGRCGCRTPEQAIQVGDAIAEFDSLQLIGLEVYEGIIHGDRASEKIETLLADVIHTTERLATLQAFDTNEIILTGAGSAWYDLVATHFNRTDFSFKVLPVIRPGAYLIHDKGIYKEAQKHLLQRSQNAQANPGNLQSCLEIWAYVQSLPEPRLALVNMGKRDVAYDAGLPQPALHFRPGNVSPMQASESWVTRQIMDQHAFLEIPPEADIKVGDIVAFSTSHPCLTFDKWQRLCVIDNEYNVIECLYTKF